VGFVTFCNVKKKNINVLKYLSLSRKIRVKIFAVV